ncbi:nuclear transport factor 2 family protein [Catenuloplanes atrovinosus]|uniref:Ketosteroid isomerase-like protein n=1 Tax=Catenuloplanes atrovinosus TaxID=137266 RepID=A0AAE3YPT0_9ACTN|nr:nuclear transport factor 2 family protein [Catenuloplanes atrovinosus]MDR7277445.1 ketosteroid isomerase-like protein [Catenuloplanes atrovinosus]
MTENITVAERYATAWMGRDLDAAMAFVADDVVLDAPSGRFEGAAAYRGFLERFMGLMTAAEITAVYGGEDGAAVHYVTRTKPVAVSRGADRLVIRDGLIREAVTIFDRQPFTEAQARAQAQASDRE